MADKVASLNLPCGSDPAHEGRLFGPHVECSSILALTPTKAASPVDGTGTEL